MIMGVPVVSGQYTPLSKLLQSCMIWKHTTSVQLFQGPQEYLVGIRSGFLYYSISVLL